MRTKGLWRSAALAATVLCGALAPNAGAAPGSGPTASVSLGDSYISGEGGRWNGNSNQQLGSRDRTDRAWTGFGYDRAPVYLEGTGADGGCHRSDVAEIRSAGLGYAEAINLSCSGATSANVWRAASGGQPRNGEAPQADRLAAVAGGQGRPARRPLRRGQRPRLRRHHRRLRDGVDDIAELVAAVLPRRAAAGGQRPVADRAGQRRQGG